VISPRVPPEGEDLEFIENIRTGTVHILPWDDTPPEKIPECNLADFVVALLTGSAPQMLCGTRLRHTWPGAPGQPCPSSRSIRWASGPRVPATLPLSLVKVPGQPGS
jgi:hypothetical protein